LFISFFQYNFILLWYLSGLCNYVKINSKLQYAKFRIRGEGSWFTPLIAVCT